jgi:2-hydroxychromene-2-carboxylate isomerase
MLAFDMYWSFRSPYCYLALDRILNIQNRYEVEVIVKLVYPLAVRTPDFFRRINPQYRTYHTLDSKRIAEFLGVPFRRPIPDPIVQDMVTNKISPHQPHIFRLTRLGAAAALRDRGLPFIEQISRLLWDGSTDDWSDGDHLSKATTRAGLNLKEMDQDIAADPDRFDRLIKENQKDHEMSGHWGVPTFVFDGEPFYGQDRIDHLLWRLKQNGLAERN